jgi:hypothetical protein
VALIDGEEIDVQPARSGWRLERPSLARQHSEGVMDAEKLSREMEEKI